MTIIDEAVAKECFASLLELAKAGEEIDITSPGHPTVRLVRVEERSGLDRPRELGALAGKMWISPDFDAPLPDEIARAFGMLDES